MDRRLGQVRGKFRPKQHFSADLAGRYTLGDPWEADFSSGDTYGVARDRPALACEVVEPPSPDAYLPSPVGRAPWT
jgi:hypothetical protein